MLGAGIAGVMTLLSKEFVLLLAITGLIGLPTGYWIGLQFLKNYAYHISMRFGTLTFGLGIMLIIGLLAVGTQTWRIARENPVEALKNE